MRYGTGDSDQAAKNVNPLFRRHDYYDYFSKCFGDAKSAVSGATSEFSHALAFHESIDGCMLKFFTPEATQDWKLSDVDPFIHEDDVNYWGWEKYFDLNRDCFISHGENITNTTMFYEYVNETRETSQDAWDNELGPCLQGLYSLYSTQYLRYLLDDELFFAETEYCIHEGLAATQVEDSESNENKWNNEMNKCITSFLQANATSNPPVPISVTINSFDLGKVSVTNTGAANIIRSFTMINGAAKDDVTTAFPAG
jgi:hypothetical protein